MIKDVFVPEKIGTYYLFAKRVLGFDVGKTVVHACQVYLRGHSITIEKCYEERIAPGDNASYDERVGQAIRSIVDAAPKKCSIYSAIDSSRIIFKKLTLPFLNYEKIKKVIYFEVEPLLPFPLHEAIVDFIIVGQDKEQEKSEVLVAAVQHKQLEEHLELFRQAEVSPEVVTVDLFALYGLYRRIPSYAKLEGDVALIDLGAGATRVAYIHDQKLNFIRTLPKGMSTVAKMVAEQLGISATDAMERMMRFGLERNDDPDYKVALDKALTSFWSDISFTLRSFSMRTDELSIQKILLLGVGSEIKGLADFVSRLLNLSCEPFTVNELFKDKNISIKKNHRIASSGLISLAVVLPSPITEHFNLRQQEQSLKYTLVVNKQLIIGLSLIGLALTMLFIHTFLQVRKLRNEYKASEKQAVAVLRDQLPQLGAGNLKTLVGEAREAVGEEEKRIALMSPTRASYLNYLLELITRIDKKTLGFVIDRVSIGDGVMIIKGRVKGYPELRKLEESLRESKLFNYPGSQEKTEFEDLTVELVQNTKEL